MRKTYQLEDLDCAVCAEKMEKAIKELEGIEDANVNFITQKMTIETSQNIEEMMEKIVKLVAKIEPDCTIVL